MARSLAGLLLCLACGLALCPESAAAEGVPRLITDCARAFSGVEKSICGDRDLADLDGRLSLLYSEFISLTRYSSEAVSEQRDWVLHERDSCDGPACIRKAYERRIGRLESMLGRFDKTFVRTLCASLTDPATRGRILRETTDVEDINNDGQREIERRLWDDTARVSRPEYLGGSDRKPISIEPVEFDRNRYRTYGAQAFRYDRKTFVLHSYDELLKEPAYVSCIGPDNRERVLCEFRNEIVPAVEFAQDGESAVCEAAIAHSPDIEHVVLKDGSPAAGMEPGSPETSLRGSGPVDIDNDGRNENVLALSYSNGSGRGCDFNYFDLPDSERSPTAEKEKRRRFLAMQGVGESGYRGRNCGRIVNRLFRYRGRTYYEHNADDQRDDLHEIFLLSGGGSKTVCRYRRTVGTSLSSPR